MADIICTAVQEAIGSLKKNRFQISAKKLNAKLLENGAGKVSGDVCRHTAHNAWHKHLFLKCCAGIRRAVTRRLYL